jgi:hypothetical protein
MEGENAFAAIDIGSPESCVFVPVKRLRIKGFHSSRQNRPKLWKTQDPKHIAMPRKQRTSGLKPSLLHTVALLAASPRQRLARGQVGTIVARLDRDTLLVEFDDGWGRARAITPCPEAHLLVLRTDPRPSARLTRVQRKELKLLAALADEAIDTSDAQELRDWSRRRTRTLQPVRPGAISGSHRCLSRRLV